MTLDDAIWTERYGHVCPPKRGKIITIHGIGTKDAYNPGLYEYGGTQILAFRAEARRSDALSPSTYHPTICFARFRPCRRHTCHRDRD